jgi:alpha-galactosidase
MGKRAEHAFEVVEVLPVDVRLARVYEHGWQSWSPAATYAVDATSYRPGRPEIATMCYRPERPAPARGFQGEGLLAVDPGDGGPVRVYGATGPIAVPSIRAALAHGRLTVSADRPVTPALLPGPLPAALGSWADGYLAGLDAAAAALRPAPTGWCSWYHYYTDVTEADVVENLAAIGAAELPVDVIQLDDGWQAEIGDWLAYSDRFASLADLAARIREAGRRPGIWVAPFLVGARSQIARDHPGWLVGGPDAPVDAGRNWDQDLYALDVTDAGAAGYLRAVFGRLAGYGFDYYKLDFLYAGALDGPRAAGARAVSSRADGARADGGQALPAYRAGLRLIRDTVGPNPYLLGCGAPMLPSVGLVDAMRVSADISPDFEPEGGDPSRPSQLGATLSVLGRAFQHGRFWVNDPDCVLARPSMRGRKEWAAVVERYGGLRCSSDRIVELDEWGLATTRRLLSSVPRPEPFPTEHAAGIIQ